MKPPSPCCKRCKGREERLRAWTRELVLFGVAEALCLALIVWVIHAYPAVMQTGGR